MRFPASVTVGVLAGAALILLPFARQPVHASARARRANGARLFHERGCEHCHGIDARGTERGPDLGTVGKQWKKPDIDKQIREGGSGMPAFGEILAPDEVGALVDFLGAKKKVSKGSKSGVPAPAPDPAKPDVDSSGQ